MPKTVTTRPAAAEADSATRDRVLLEAARLFRHHGYAATTLRQVADAAGIKAGSIYYHFESKEQILGEVLDKGIQAVDAAVRQRVDALAARCQRTRQGRRGDRRTPVGAAAPRRLHIGQHPHLRADSGGGQEPPSPDPPPLRGLLGRSAGRSLAPGRAARRHRRHDRPPVRHRRAELDGRVVQPPEGLLRKLRQADHDDRLRRGLREEVAIALDELLPDRKAQGAPLLQPATGDDVLFLSQTGARCVQVLRAHGAEARQNGRVIDSLAHQFHWHVEGDAHRVAVDQ